MYIPLGVKTDYSLLKSLIKIPELMKYLNNHKITACSILDNNLFGAMCFYTNCKKNNIKPIIGLDVKINTNNIYLYAKNYNGYKNLLKINTSIQKEEIDFVKLQKYNQDIVCVVPYSSIDLYEELNKIYTCLYVGYKNDYEKKNASVLTKDIVYVNICYAYKFSEIKYLGILREIDTGIKEDISKYTDAYLEIEVSKEDEETTIKFSELFNLEIKNDQNYIPHYDLTIKDSYNYLCSLCKKGLEKRLNGNISKEYSDRLLMELNIIHDMGFVDYFLIVYDYVKFAKTHDILVGPGRGSAAGSLVSYCLGITNVDPIQYNLLLNN